MSPYAGYTPMSPYGGYTPLSAPHVACIARCPPDGPIVHPPLAPLSKPSCGNSVLEIMATLIISFFHLLCILPAMPRYLAVFRVLLASPQ